MLYQACTESKITCRSGLRAALFCTLASIVLASAFSPRIEAQPQLAAPRFSEERHTQEAGDTELRQGIELTRRGRFKEAIPHLRAAQSGSNQFAAGFNLALCYVATGDEAAALPILQALLKSGHATASVYNLQAQALIGLGRPDEAFEAFQRGAALEPKNERLYVLAADSCMDRGAYDLCLKILSAAIEKLPGSARLRYQRGVLFSFFDQPDNARRDLQLASEAAPGTTISFLAEAQRGMLDGVMSRASSAARQGLRKEPENYVLLTILGQALLRQGVRQEQPEFAEARGALEKSVAGHPDYAPPRIALGQLYLMSDRVEDAIAQLEKARQLLPNDPSVYSQLAVAYRRRGDLPEAQKMLAALEGLNQAQAAKYKLDPPDHKGSYIGSSKP